MIDYKSVFDLSRRIGKLKHKAVGCRERSFTHAQLAIMLETYRLIAEGEKDVTSSMLAQELDMPKPQISKNLNCMEMNGMVKRRISKNDRRVVYISITDKGLSLLKKERADYEEMIEYIYNAIGKEDFDELLRIFTKMEKAMEAKECSNS